MKIRIEIEKATHIDYKKFKTDFNTFHDVDMLVWYCATLQKRPTEYAIKDAIHDTMKGDL